MITTTFPGKKFEEEQSNSNLILREVWEKNVGSLAITHQQSILNTVISKLREAVSLVCISSNVGVPKEVLQEIPKLAQKGVRVYLLLHSYEDTYQDFVADKAIIRINPDAIGLMLLIDPKEALETKSGYLFGYDALENDGVSYFTAFNGRQLKEAFHYFVFTFWNSFNEYRGRSRSVPSSLRAPFDIYPLLDPETVFNDSWDKSYLTEKIREIIQSASSKLQISLSSFKQNEEIWSLIKDKAEQGVQVFIYTGLYRDHTFLKELPDRQNITIFSTEYINTYFILADDQFGLYLSGTIHGHNELGITLSAKDVQDVQGLLDSLKGQMWTFHNSIELDRIAGEEIIYEKFNGKVKPLSIQYSEVIDYGTVEAKELRQYFEGLYKPTFKQEDRLARTIIHRWKLVPKTLDEKAKIDPLYEQWDKETGKLKKHLNEVLQFANAVRKEKASLKSLWGRLFQREDTVDIDIIIKDLDLALSEINRGVYNWKNSLSLLSTIDNYVTTLVKEQLGIHETQDYYDKKNIWEEEKNQVISEKQKNVDLLTELDSKYNNLLEEINQVSPEVQEQLGLLQSQLEAEETTLGLIEEDHQEIIQAKKIELKVLELCAFLNNHIGQFNKVKKKHQKSYFESKVKHYLLEEIDKVGKLPVLESILENNKITNSKELMQYVMKQLATHPDLRMKTDDANEHVLIQYEETAKRKSDLEKQIDEFRNRNKGDKKEHQKSLQELDKEKQKFKSKIQSLDKKLEQLGEEFTYMPKKKDLKVPFSSSILIQLPAEELPKVGHLYRVGQNRQLTISGHNDLNQGEVEAERLKAELVLKV